MNAVVHLKVSINLINIQFKKKKSLWNITILGKCFLLIYCKNVIYSCDQSWIFSIITPVISVTWSSEIILICWLAVQEAFLIVKKSCAASYFLETAIHFIFQESLLNRKFKRIAFIWKHFVTNVYTVTSDQFNGSLQNYTFFFWRNGSV